MAPKAKAVISKGKRTGKDKGKDKHEHRDPVEVIYDSGVSIHSIFFDSGDDMLSVKTAICMLMFYPHKSKQRHFHDGIRGLMKGCLG